MRRSCRRKSRKSIQYCRSSTAIRREKKKEAINIISLCVPPEKAEYLLEYHTEKYAISQSIQISIWNDNWHCKWQLFYALFKNYARKERRKRKEVYQKNLEQIISPLMGLSVLALVYPRGVPTEVPLDGLKILNHLIIKDVFFSHAREHLYSPYTSTL